MKPLLLLSLAATLSLVCCHCNKATTNPDTTPKEYAQTLFDSTVVWSLATMQGEAIEADAPCTLVLNPQSGMLYGTSFINSYSGTFQVTEEGTLEIGNVAMTQMAGPEALMALESRFHQAFATVNAYRLEANTLTLMHNNTDVLTFIR